MDYSQLSDFEINKRVAQLHGGFALTLAVHDEPPSGKSFDPGRFDPCNNPADAWPIISANRISLMYDKSTEEGNEAQWCLASSPCDQHIVDYVSESKLLRAAMIVFLMIQENQNG
ncbi:phage protein NinX family protein [Enterobacter ludwigii]|uniref:phage protein NinX family protein n=1 Tax=Enterobacter ludwigii TaxID=299767 RepID=UPI0022E24451|nr:phage protein NinX family protein [Enterobacter ludwigii]